MGDKWTLSTTRTLSELEREFGALRGTVTEWTRGESSVTVQLRSHPDNPDDDAREYWVNYELPSGTGAGEEGRGGIHGTRSEAEAAARGLMDEEEV